MLRAIDQPSRGWTCSSRWCVGLSVVQWVPRPRSHRYSRPNRASSRPSDAISLLHPSLYYPAINPSVPLGLSPTVLNRAGTLRCAVSKFPADKKENRCSLSPPALPRPFRVDTSLHVPRHPALRTRKRTRLATNGSSRNRRAGRNPDALADGLSCISQKTEKVEEEEGER